MLKYTAPIIVFIIVAILFTLYGLGIISALISDGVLTIIPVAVGIGVICLIGALTYVLIQRLKEIKEEDEDDISKY